MLHINNLSIDIKANRGNLKSLFFILFFRLSHFFTKNTFLKIIGFPIRVCYRFFTRNIMNLEIWDEMELGNGFVIWHGAQSSVLNPRTKICNNVTLRQNTTIGSSSFTQSDLCPLIEENVQIGPNCVIIGKITVGKNSIIGAGSVVINDVPEAAIVAGNPARIISYRNNL